MKLLIIGNGSIGTYQNSKFYINNNIGNFLRKLDTNFEIIISQNYTIYDQNVRFGRGKNSLINSNNK